MCDYQRINKEIEADASMVSLNNEGQDDVHSGCRLVSIALQPPSGRQVLVRLLEGESLYSHQTEATKVLSAPSSVTS